MLVEHYISNRVGGVSKPPYEELNLAYHTGDDPHCVKQNREILLKQTKLKEIVFMDQIHSDRIEYVDRACTPRCDGIITDRADLGLAVMSADCYGVLLWADDAPVIAALHAGRAGAMKKIVAKAIERMQKEFGASKIEAIISPGIGSCCYEVGEEIVNQVSKRYIKNGRYLDIKLMIIDDLNAYGVPYKDYNICTCCNPSYYSYRREGVTGRFASVIWRRDERVV